MLLFFKSSSCLRDVHSESWDWLDMVETGLLVIQTTVSNVFGFTTSLYEVVRICIECLDSCYSLSDILWISRSRWF